LTPSAPKLSGYPLDVNPGARIHDGSELTGIRFPSGRQHGVQLAVERVDLFLKIQQPFTNLGRVHAVPDAPLGSFRGSAHRGTRQHNERQAWRVFS